MSGCSIDFAAEIRACPVTTCTCTAILGCKYRHPESYENVKGDKCNTGEADPVNNPSHYASGAVECIDAIQASMSVEAFRGYCQGNVQKYVWRYEKKGGAEDLRKAEWYLKRLLATFDADA